MAPGHVGGRSAYSRLKFKTYQSLTSKIKMGQVKKTTEGNFKVARLDVLGGIPSQFRH